MAKNYNADSITVLEGLEAVRRRPGMYIGSIGSRGLNRLIYEILDNSVDEERKSMSHWEKTAPVRFVIRVEEFR